MGLAVFEKAIWANIEDCKDENSPDSMTITDGHSSHTNLPVSEEALKRNHHICLRPPHTSHVSQDLDVVQFKKFKALERKAKHTLFVQRVLTDPKARLTKEDITLVTKEPWEEAFSVENNKKGWAQIGLNPFNRRVQWELLAKEKAAEAKLEKKPDSKFDSTAHLSRMDLATAVGKPKEQAPLPLTEQERKDGKLTNEEMLFNGPVNSEKNVEVMRAKAKRKQDERDAVESRKKQRTGEAEDKTKMRREAGRILYDAGTVVSMKLTDEQITCMLIYRGLKPVGGLKVDRFKQLSGSVSVVVVAAEAV